MRNDGVQHTRLRRADAEARDSADQESGVIDPGLDVVAKPATVTASSARWSARRQGSDLVIVLTGDWIARETGVVATATEQILASKRPRALIFDAKRLGRWDSALI